MCVSQNCFSSTKQWCEESYLLLGVVHVVVDGVNTGLAGARVTADGAAGGSRGLSGGVGNGVAGAGAAALEGVVETEPVTNLVGGGVAEVVAGGRAAGEGGVQDGAAIIVPRVGARGDRGGEVAVAQVAAERAEDVDVEGAVGALAELLLVGELGVVAGPVGVDGVVNALVDELDVVGSESLVHDGELVGDLALGDIAARERGGGGDDVEVDIDVDGGTGSDVAGSSESSLLSSESLGDLEVLTRRLVGTAAELEVLGGEDGASHDGGGGEGLEKHGEGGGGSRLLELDAGVDDEKGKKDGLKPGHVDHLYTSFPS